MEHRIIIAGFGGQGIMFLGKLLAYSGMLENKHVTWIPSYGPEMRGGTANCAVVISDKKIGSPIVDEPDFAVVMNKASCDKFCTRVKENGILIINSSIVTDHNAAGDKIKVFDVPANKIAEECGSSKAANIVLLGSLVGQGGIISQETAVESLKNEVGSKRPELLSMNIKAFEQGLGWAKKETPC